MDEAVAELLSRHLDGDLEEAEARALKARLDAEPALQAELEALARLRAAVAALAASEDAPRELDVALAARRRTAPRGPVRLRPAYRWLAAAATLLLGITVTYQVAEHSRSLAPPARQQNALAPEVSVAEETRSSPPHAITGPAAKKEQLGDANRVEPSRAAPLQAPPAPRAVERSGRAAGEQQISAAPMPIMPQSTTALAGGKGWRERDSAEPATEGEPALPAAAPAPMAGQALRSAVAARSTEDQLHRTRAKQAPGHDQAPATGATLLLETPAGKVRVQLPPRVAVANGPYRVAVTVKRHAVSAARAASGEEGGGLEALLSELVGLSVPGLDDGDYTGEVAVAPPGEADSGVALSPE
jgi:hypothetical protein